ncbi:HAD-like domain-containing protein [Xylariomycetidae sp. FL2044]|nr:HAD-like domain-containing protein [Xylariomycetidae sp. FL2044]
MLLGDELRGTPAVERAVRSWHRQAAWPDVRPALAALRRDLGVELFVLANGTTRLQLDLVRSAGLLDAGGGGGFDMLFSSQLLGADKPDPGAYERALALVGLGRGGDADRAVMVAAHAYDTRAAARVGMRTVYVRRWTDDVGLDMEAVRRENDVFLGEGGMSGLVEAIEALG